jgi:hypothetical protein
MPSAFVTRLAVCDASIAQPTSRRENTSRTTAQYTLPSRVGCSVISVTQSSSGRSRVELALHEIAGCREVWCAAVAGPPRDTVQMGASHQQGDRFVTNLDPMAERQLGVHAPSAIDTTEVRVDLADHVGEPGLSDRSLRRWPIALGVEP